MSSRALAALMPLAVWSGPADAQDTAVTARHLLAIDIARVQPFTRTYDIVVQTRDSAILIGQRELILSESRYRDAPAWLLVEKRTGPVPAIESLYVATDMRPLHWSAALGLARLGIEFVGDSILGATTAPTGRQNILMAGRPDLIVSGAMIEMLLPLLPLSSTWADSVGALTIDLTSKEIRAASLAVVADFELSVESAPSMQAWLVELRSEDRRILLLIDKASGVPVSIVQRLPLHVGEDLEFLLRPQVDTPPPP